MQNSLAQVNLYLAFYMINIVIGICYTRYNDIRQIKIYQKTITANYYDQTIQRLIQKNERTFLKHHLEWMHRIKGDRKISSK